MPLETLVWQGKKKKKKRSLLFLFRKHYYGRAEYPLCTVWSLRLLSSFRGCLIACRCWKKNKTKQKKTKCFHWKRSYQLKYQIQKMFHSEVGGCKLKSLATLCLNGLSESLQWLKFNTYAVFLFKTSEGIFHFESIRDPITYYIKS